MSATRTTVVAMLVLVLTFGAGIIAGAAAHHLLGHREGIPPFAMHAIVNRLDRRLDLTDAQRRQVEAIMRRHQANINTAWSDVRPRVRKELEAANVEIMKVLTPEQRVKYAKMKMHLLHPPNTQRKGSTR